MTERDEELERGVALAKSGLRAPSEARARVRARLAAEALAASAARAASTGAVPLANMARFARAARSPSHALRWAVTWVGLGLCAGYWLGFHRIGASLIERGSDAAEAARGAAIADGDPGGVAPGPSTRGAASEATALESRGSGAEPRASSVATQSPEKPSPSAGAAAETLAGGEPTNTPGVDTPSSSLGGEPARERRRANSAVLGAARNRSTTRATVPLSTGLDAAASSFAAEVALLERAERAIRAGEGALAIVFLDELDQKFPASSLGEERAAARVLAGCERARSNGASARAAARVAASRFLAQGSAVYADRVRQLCELGAENAPSSVEDPDRRGH